MTEGHAPIGDETVDESVTVTTEQVASIAELAADYLRTTHWDGTGCGTNGSSGCSRCYGPSPADAVEVASDVLKIVLPLLACAFTAARDAEKARADRAEDVLSDADAQFQILAASKRRWMERALAAERGAASLRARLDAMGEAEVEYGFANGRVGGVIIPWIHESRGEHYAMHRRHVWHGPPEWIHDGSRVPVDTGDGEQHG